MPEPAGAASLLRGCRFPSLLVFLRFNFQDETPTTNFDTFPAAILTVFQVRPLLCTFADCPAPVSPGCWEGGLSCHSLPCSSTWPRSPTFQTQCSSNEGSTGSRQRADLQVRGPQPLW